MNEVREVLAILDSNIQSVEETETVRTLACLNRILAEPVIAAEDDPAFDNSAMDGYVFLKQDLNRGRRSFQVEQIIRPENDGAMPIESGTCAYITTGSRIPPGGDFVIPVELTEEKDEGTVYIREVPSKNAVRKQGEGYHKGEVLLSAGKRIRAVDTGVIRLNGYDSVEVKRKLRIAIQATGSELDERKNTNTPVLVNLFDEDPSVDVEAYPVIEDDEEKMKKRFAELLEESDIIITTGGISAGEFDLVIPVMESLGVNFLIRKVNQKPGKPFSYGYRDRTWVFCLPGNPVSAFFCAVFYVRRALKYLLGETGELTRTALLQNRYACGKRRTEFVPGILVDNGVKKEVTTQSGIRSHLLHNLSAANCFVQMEPGVTYSPDDVLTVIPFYE